MAEETQPTGAGRRRKIRRTKRHSTTISTTASTTNTASAPRKISGRQRAADQTHRNLQRTALLAHHRRRQRRAGRDADEGVHGIPQRVEPGQLVGKELDHQQHAGNPQHQRMGQHAKAAGQLYTGKARQCAEHEDQRVEAQPAGPAEPGRQEMK